MLRTNILTVLLYIGGCVFSLPVTPNNGANNEVDNQDGIHDSEQQISQYQNGNVGGNIETSLEVGNGPEVNAHFVVEKRQHNRLISFNSSDEIEAGRANVDESGMDWDLHFGSDQDSLFPDNDQPKHTGVENELENRGKYYEQNNDTDTTVFHTDEHETGAIGGSVDKHEGTDVIASESESHHLDPVVDVTEEPLDQFSFTQSIRQLPDTDSDEYLPSSDNHGGSKTDNDRHQNRQESGIDVEQTREPVRPQMPDSGFEQPALKHLDKEQEVTTSSGQVMTSDSVAENGGIHEEQKEEHEEVRHLPVVTEGDVLPTVNGPIRSRTIRRQEPPNLKKEEHVPTPKPEVTKEHMPIDEGKVEPEHQVTASPRQHPNHGDGLIPSTPAQEPTEGPRHLPFDQGGLATNSPKPGPTEGPRHLPYDQGGLATDSQNLEPTEGPRHLPFDQEGLATNSGKPEPTEGQRHLPYDQGGLARSSTKTGPTPTPRQFLPDESGLLKTSLSPEPTGNGVHLTRSKESTSEKVNPAFLRFSTSHYSEVTAKIIPPDEQVTELVQQKTVTESIEYSEQIPEVVTNSTVDVETTEIESSDRLSRTTPTIRTVQQHTKPIDEGPDLDEKTTVYYQTEPALTDINSIQISTLGDTTIAEKENVNENRPEILKTTKKATPKPTKKDTPYNTGFGNNSTIINTVNAGVDTTSSLSSSIHPTKSTPESGEIPFQQESRSAIISNYSSDMLSSSLLSSYRTSTIGSTPMLILSTADQSLSNKESSSLSIEIFTSDVTSMVSSSVNEMIDTSTVKPMITETETTTTKDFSQKPAISFVTSSVVESSEHSTFLAYPASSHTINAENITAANEVPLPMNKITDSVSTKDKPYINIDMKMALREFCMLRSIFLHELVEVSTVTAEGPLNEKNILMQYPGLDDCEQQWDTYKEWISIQIYILDMTGKVDNSMTVEMAKYIKPRIQSNKQFGEKLGTVKVVRKVPNIEQLVPRGNTPSYIKEEEEIETGIVIAITIASVGGFCCVCLLVLQIVIHKRSGKKIPFGGSNCSSRLSNRSFNSAIALNDVSKSRPNSGLWNPALDLDDEICRDPSHPLVYSALTDFALETDSVHQEFQRIPNETPRLSCVPIGAEDKNRFANVLPFPHTRVRLKKIPGEDCSDYINANYITGYKNDLRAYIATQAPLSSTAADLWRMVWEQQSRVVLMLTDMDERGKPRCIPYWPDKTGIENRVMYGDYCITLKKKEIHQEYIVSILDIKDIERNLVREVRHFWYTCWPTDTTPEPISLVKFVLDTRPYYEDSGAPVIIHCSPGTGRTGTLIAIDICMRSFEDKRSVNILHTVYKMRKERAGTVQTKDQYNLIYKAVSEYAIVMNTPTSISTSSSVATLQNML